jgi:hypothetical protein
MKKIIVVLLLLFTFSFAKLTSAQSLPAACFSYSAVDNFESTSANWSPWNNSITGSIVIGDVSGAGARSGFNAIRMTFGSTEPNGSFLVVDSVFDSTTSIDPTLSTRYPSRGCPTHIPYFPSGTLKYCSADIFIKPIHGAVGLFELIDPNTYIILAQKSFSYSPSTTWFDISIPNTTSCESNMVVRVEMDRNSSSNMMLADDLTITWHY